MPRISGAELSLEDYAQHRHGNGSDDCRGGQGDDPRQSDRLHQVPISCLVDNAHAQHGADEDVGGRNRPGSVVSARALGESSGRLRQWP